MADTHLNAFEMEVQEAYKKVTEAHAEYDRVKAALAAKKQELGLTDTEPSAAPEQQSNSDKNTSKKK